ncbi:MAG: hypothetical protein ACYDIE_07190 [Candidatus Krumholzibacteriia bacterium]
MSLWDEVRANMSEWYAVAADKTEEMARIGVRKYDKFTISRDIERVFTDLGSHVYAAVREGRTDFTHDVTVHDAVERLRALELQLAQKEREIAAIRGVARPRPQAGGGSGVAAVTPTGRGAAGGPELPVASPGAPAAGEPDEVEIEASLDPRGGGADDPRVDAWDDEIALWNEPLDLDDEPGETGGAARDPRPGRD